MMRISGIYSERSEKGARRRWRIGTRTGNLIRDYRALSRARVLAHARDFLLLPVNTRVTVS
jgi:hypothetical protein